MNKTIFKISKMDCPSEEQMIRMKLSEMTTIKSLDFDIPNRKLIVFHTDEKDKIFKKLEELKFDTSIVESFLIENFITPIENVNQERKLLWQVLVINFFFFVVEIFTGFVANSMGLIADSFDMLADSFVYALALFAVGGTLLQKKIIAKFAGYFQLLIAVLGFIEVIRRFLDTESKVNYPTMIVVSIFALLGNGLCLYLLQKSKSKEAHMQASMIFTSNDVIVNLSVFLAGILIYFTNSNYPDLIIGSLVFILVAFGAFKILKLAR